MRAHVRYSAAMVMGALTALAGCQEHLLSPAETNTGSDDGMFGAESVYSLMDHDSAWVGLDSPGDITHAGVYQWTVTAYGFHDYWPEGQRLAYVWTISENNGATWQQVRTCGVPDLTCGPTDVYSRSIVSGDPPFILRVVAFDTDFTTAMTKDTVAVPNPLYSQLTTYFNGPAVVSSSGSYSWEAFPTGGTGSYSYQWLVQYPEIGGGWTSLGTSKTQSRFIDASDGDLIIRVEVMSGVQAANYTASVVNAIGCDPEIFC